MNTSYNYEIYSQEVQPTTKVTPGEITLTYTPKSDIFGWIWVIGIIVAILIGASKSSWIGFFAGIVITYALTEFVQREINKEEKAKIAEQKNQEIENVAHSTARQNINNAQRLSDQLNNMLMVSSGLVQELPSFLQKASSSLERARSEFSCNAFSPYWDCIEQATRNLASFNNNIQQIRNYADQYYKLLQNKKHNFPSFFPVREIFPDSVPVINELNTVVRPGLTNFQFATIWEHRKTQNILIQGFGTLGDAISNMAASICDSISQLHDAISSNTTQMIDQQIMSRESYERYSTSHLGLMEDQIKRLESLDRKIK